jgi:hypothetical protein
VVGIGLGKGKYQRFIWLLITSAALKKILKFAQDIFATM